MKITVMFLMALIYGSQVFGAAEVKCKSSHRFPYSVAIEGLSSENKKLVTIKRKNRIVYRNVVKAHEQANQKDFVLGRQFAMSISKRNSFANLNAVVREEGGRKMIADGHMACKIL
ncbi:MAG: hypothetical protein SGI74_04160 [Oligoflexia bacterium]|nr:hypothetical protein [Oligoflexia bacterium]